MRSPFLAVAVSSLLSFMAMPIEASQTGGTPITPTRLELLVNSPSNIVATELGSVQQLRVFHETAGTQTEVTSDTGTSYQSSNAAVVSVTSTGLMTFLGPGQAQLTAGFGGLSARTDVEVDPNGKAMVSVEIGGLGGVVHLANGTGVTIPPGALAGHRTIEVAEVDLPIGTTWENGSTPVAPAYGFGPDGTTFAAPVSLSIAFDPSGVPPGFDPESVLIHQLLTGDVLGIEAYAGPFGAEDAEESVNQSLDLDAGIVSSNVRHFSERTLLARQNPIPVTLVAPDGTRLQVLRLIKTERPGPGPDGKYGIPDCDDNADGEVDDFYEFEMSGAACTPGTVDDVARVPETRNVALIRHIVLHSTSSEPGTRFSGDISWAQGKRSLYWAQYYVGKEGTIVQISEDSTLADHAKGNPALGINSENSIGIEIFNATNVNNYPGRQMAAVVRLVDYLLRVHPGIARPSAADPDGNLITHFAQRPPGSNKIDPINNYRTAVMGSPSLETILYRALRTDTITGIVNARGGDAYGPGAPGDGGIVLMESGVSALENEFVDGRPSIQITAGNSAGVGSGNLMHLLVDGTATFAGDTTIDLDGILYVGPNGVLDARGGFDGHNGRKLTFTADGFAFIEGRVLVNGTDKLGTNELPPWNQPPFSGGTGNGNGGMAGELRYRTAAPGFLWVPSIVSRGGDGDNSASGFQINGGRGGAVTIRGNSNSSAEDVIVLARGHQNSPQSYQHEVGMPDYLPQPPPFNLMPIIVTNPVASGACPADLFATTDWLRPQSGERLALGRSINPTTREVLGNVSLVNRGIVTCGGMGANPASTADAAGFGGAGGNVEIANLTAGYIRFLDQVQIVSGSGAERIASVIFVVSTCDDFEFFNLPSGGMGGRGPFAGGNGGIGGNGGNITVTGRIWPYIGAPAVPPNITTTNILGFNGDNPHSSVGVTIGALKTCVDEGFATSSSRGSGGSPAGHASGFPGFFGLAGSNGTTRVNGATIYP